MNHEHADEYDPKCPGCRPRLMSTNGVVIPEAMQRAVDLAFDSSPLELRQAWYRAVVKKSADPGDIEAIGALSNLLHVATGMPVVTDPLVTVGVAAQDIVRMLEASNVPFLEALAAVKMTVLTMSRSLKPEDEQKATEMAWALFSKPMS